MGVPYNRDALAAGESKYTFSALIHLALDGLLSFSTAPLRFASYFGLLTAFAGMIYVAYAVMARLFGGGVPDGWTSLVAIFLVVGGMQLLVLGIIGEYLARVYDETKQRPQYVISERVAPGGGA